MALLAWSWIPGSTFEDDRPITADLDRAYVAIESTIGATDVAALGYHILGIAYSEHWGPPGQAAAVLRVKPNQQVPDLQASLLVPVISFTGTGGTDAAFVTDPGQQIGATKDWVETYQPNQVGADYTAQLTVRLVAALVSGSTSDVGARSRAIRVSRR